MCVSKQVSVSGLSSALACHSISIISTASASTFQVIKCQTICACWNFDFSAQNTADVWEGGRKESESMSNREGGREVVKETARDSCDTEPKGAAQR